MKSIICNDISKTYKLKKQSIVALTNINLEVNQGELFGLIGPDGSGKTSLIRILTSLILPDAGSGYVDNLNIIEDFEELRKRIGYMPGRFSLYQDLTVEENLNFFASVFNTTIKSNYELIKDIYQQIEPFKNRRAGALSGGMKQKLALSCALIHRPKVLFLDEPTTGVDAVSRLEFWEMLKNLQKKGMTIFVSTPYMDEASLCNRIALIQNGKLMTISTPDEVRHSYSGDLYSVQANNMFKLLIQLKSWQYTKSVFSFGDSLHLSLINNQLREMEIKDYLNSNSISDAKISKIVPSVEDRFMQLMKHA